jgi:hypothetical protein
MLAYYITTAAFVLLLSVVVARSRDASRRMEFHRERCQARDAQWRVDQADRHTELREQAR